MNGKKNKKNSARSSSRGNTKRTKRNPKKRAKPSRRRLYGDRYISKAVRDKVSERDNNRCVYCGKRGRAGSWFRKEIRLEYGHHIPHSSGGSNCLENIQLECFKCNRSKGASYEEIGFWKEKVFGYGAEGCKNKRCKHLK